MVTLAFEGEDGQQIIYRIVHIRAMIGRFAVGNPPQTQHRHHMVDTQCPTVLHVGAQQIDKRCVSTRDHHMRVHRWQPPVLPERPQNIRRRADRRFQAVQLAVTPGFRPAFRHANGQIAIQTNRHVVALTLLPAGRKLAVRQPLQPQEEVHLIRVFFTECFHFRGINGLIRLWPHRPAPAHFVLFHLIRMQRIKCRLPVKAFTFLSDKLTERRHLVVIAR
ncbi:hypothetical protein D3C78_1072330 [compost metagenome]